MSRVISLAFLHPVAGDPALNRVTGLCSQHRICHAELVFEPTPGQQSAFSIVKGERAMLRPRAMSNPNYTTVGLNVTRQEYDSCYDFCV